MEIAVFAKAPQAGAAKTRLIPALGAARAARLQRQLTLNALHAACRFNPEETTLWCAPDTHHRFFRALHSCSGINVRRQTGSHLGERMSHAFAACGRPMLLIGTDCPALQTAHLEIATNLLQNGHDAVFITAEDGGYVLVGLNRPHPRLFEVIDWGSDQVMAQTRARLTEIGLRWAEPAMLWDIDRPTDLARLATLKGFSEWRIDSL